MYLVKSPVFEPLLPRTHQTGVMLAVIPHFSGGKTLNTISTLSSSVRETNWPRGADTENAPRVTSLTVPQVCTCIEVDNTPKDVQGKYNTRITSKDIKFSLLNSLTAYFCTAIIHPWGHTRMFEENKRTLGQHWVYYYQITLQSTFSLFLQPSWSIWGLRVICTPIL